MRKLNTILEVFLYLVIIRHIIALFTTIPQIGMTISGYGSMSELALNFVLHIEMIMILLNLLKIKRWALYLFGGIQLINIAFQSLFFGRDFWELTIVATILCAIMAALLCLRKDGISAWQLFFPKKEQTQKDELDIEFEMLQEKDAPKHKNISTEIPEDEINISEATNDEFEDLTIDTLPQKEDGSLDYEKMTPIQQFAYTCKTESVEVALKDLNADIKALEKTIGKVKKELLSLSGGNRAKLRDSLREEQMKLDELYNLRNKYSTKKKITKWHILIIVASISCLICFICWISQKNGKTILTEDFKKEEIVKNKKNKFIGKYVNTREKLHSALKEEGYTDLGNLEQFIEYLEKSQNRIKLFECLKNADYDNFTNQLEFDSYLGYASVLYSCSTENEEYNIPISYIDKFENKKPESYIKFVNEGREEEILISNRYNLLEKYNNARPYLKIEIKKDYSGSKLRLLYYSLLATGYLSKEEIGTMSEFINSTNSRKKVREFYLNLRNWGFLSSEIGTEIEFCNNFDSEFEITNTNKRRILYNHLSHEYDLGDYESFSRNLDNEKKRKAFYETVSKDYDLGDYETFCKKIQNN